MLKEFEQAPRMAQSHGYAMWINLVHIISIVSVGLDWQRRPVSRITVVGGTQWDVVGDVVGLGEEIKAAMERT